MKYVQNNYPKCLPSEHEAITHTLNDLKTKAAGPYLSNEIINRGPMYHCYTLGM